MNGKDIMEGAAAQVAAAVSGPKPSLGRVVIVHSRDGAPKAGIISGLYTDDETRVDVSAFTSDPDYPVHVYLAIPAKTDLPSKVWAVWSWPERV